MNRKFATLLAICLALPVGAQADMFGSNSHKKAFRAQTQTLDRIEAGQQKSSIRLQSARVVTPTIWGSDTKGYSGTYRGPYLQMARDAARRHGVPEDLFLRLVNQESRFNPRARSHKGAIGLAQLMPFTARKLGVNPHDPYENLDGGARYLAQQYRTFKSWRLALAAYNAGPEAVRKYGGVPPYSETRKYVRKIWGV